MKKIQKDRAMRVQSERKGQEYGSGIMFSDDKSRKRGTKIANLESRRCNACGATTHWRRSSSLCPHNKKNLGSVAVNESTTTTSLKPPPGDHNTQTTPISMVKDDGSISKGRKSEDGQLTDQGS